ncbi:MAG: T9SS type A sorting domain-containing protein [Chitinophagales bacterium]
MNQVNNNIVFFQKLLLYALFLVFALDAKAQCDVDFDYVIIGDSVHFENLSSNIGPNDSFEWDLDDGTLLSVIDSLTHSYATEGIYNVCLTRTNLLAVPPCVETVCKDVVFCIDCVWPGDANSDFIADNKDVLYIGLAYGFSGPARTIDTATNWAPKISSTLWLDINSDPLDFATGVNYKHADCDGDGIVNEADLRPLDRNYNQTHNKSRPPACTNINDVPLYFEILYDSIEVGAAVEISIRLGTNNITANEAYGIAYTLHYDRHLVDSSSVEIDYDNTGFKKNPNDTIIHLNKYFDQQAEIETAVSRTNQEGKTLSGQAIGHVFFVMEDNLVQKNSTISEYLHLSFSDVYLIDSAENQIPVCAFSDSVLVYQKVAGTGAHINSNDWKIYPNPANDVLNIEVEEDEISSLNVFNLSGQNVLTVPQLNSGKTRLSLESLPNGLYFIEIRVGDTYGFKKFIKQ